MDIGSGVEFAQLLDRLLEGVLEFFEHNKAWDAVVVVNEARVLVAEVLVRHLHLVEVVLVMFSGVLAAVCSARYVGLLVWMRHEHQGIVLSLYIFMGSFTGHVEHAVEVVLD